VIAMKVNPNMDKTFREVVARVANPVAKLSHKQTVTRLYKASLKTLDSWIIDRRLWNEEATKIRAEFELHRNLDPHSG
jgi:NADH dehydrogenase (ubiquinone) 1 beta subcomplex subunit 9